MAPISRSLRTLVLASALIPGGAILASSSGLAADDPAAVRPVDLELVLAVDISSSVSREEFQLQAQGLATAFRDPAVVQAIAAAGDLGIAVALVQWSDNRRQFLATDWTLVSDAPSADAFAETLAVMPRRVVGGGTAIGGALAFSVKQIESNAFAGLRKVIDVSGDGRTNQGRPDIPLRDMAVARGVTINGLAIRNEDPELDRYYRANVIGGPGAFVVTANDYRSFAEAILAKLVREITGPPVASAPDPGHPSPRRGSPLVLAATSSTTPEGRPIHGAR